jgi:hypothetical protein
MEPEMNEGRYVGQAVVTEHGLALVPAAVFDLVGQLTDQEARELMAFASEEGPDQFPFRATAWLIRRFNLNFQK